MSVSKKIFTVIISLVLVLSFAVIDFESIHNNGVSAQSVIDAETREKLNQVVEIVNEQRAALGVQPVTLNETLTQAAMHRAEEIVELFSHDRPDGTNWKTVYKQFGISCYAYAENIAAGSSTAEGVMNQWINSSGHYKNLTNSSYNEIGVGLVYDPDSKYRYYWVQLFADEVTVQETTATTATTSVTATTTSATTVTTTVSGDAEQDVQGKILKMVELINAERAKEGIAPVVLHEGATNAAMIRAEEIVENFSHDRPDGQSCFTILDELGIECSYKGENIAYGYDDPEKTMEQWINSPPHYENIMNPDFTEVGIGYYYDESTSGEYFWTQMFINTTPNYILTYAGDINYDGNIDLTDVVVFTKILTSQMDFTSEAFYVYDINQDDKINVFDLIYLKDAYIW